MERVLIHRDSRRISQATDFLNKSVVFVQAVYDKLKSFGADLELQQIGEAIEFLQTVSLDDLSYYDNIDLPQLQALFSSGRLPALRQIILNQQPESMGIFRVEVSLMDKQGERISAKADSGNILTDRFSHYASSAIGIELTKALNKVCVSLNSFLAVAKKNNIAFNNAGGVIGLEFTNAGFRPDVSFIRDQERLKASTRAKPNPRGINDAD